MLKPISPKALQVDLYRLAVDTLCGNEAAFDGPALLNFISEIERDDSLLPALALNYLRHLIAQGDKMSDADQALPGVLQEIEQDDALLPALAADYLRRVTAAFASASPVLQGEDSE